MAYGSNRQMSGNNAYRHVGNYNASQGRINRGDHLIPPMGLPNLASCCYLNSVIQTLFLCEDFRTEMIKYAAPNQNSQKENDLFTCDLAQLLQSMTRKSTTEVHQKAEKFSRYFHHSAMGDDINKCFLQILTEVNSAIKPKVPNNITDMSFMNNAEKEFAHYRKNNNGFIFDNFNGQFLFQTKCKTCDKSLKEKYQLFRSMPLQVPKSSTETSIEDCIKNFFQGSPIDGYDNSCCGNPMIVSVTECTHVPKYLFFYLVRGSYVVGDSKNNISVKFQEKIDVPTTKGNVSYKLISVIDHFGTNQTGHYFAKVRRNCRWWLINDMQVTPILWEDVPSQYSIGLFFKQIPCDSDYENDFEKLDKEPLKPIIETLYECVDIRKALIEYYQTCQSKPDAIQNEVLKIFCEIMHLLNQETPNKARKLIQSLQLILSDNSDYENKINIYYPKLLRKIIVTNENEESFDNCSSNETRQESLSKRLSDLLIFDKLFKMFCVTCGNILVKENQTSQFIILDVQSPSSFMNAVKQHFAKTEIRNGYENNDRCCYYQRIFNTNLIVNSPKYLFFYLNMLTYAGKELSFEEKFTLPTEKGDKSYSIFLFIHLMKGRYIITYPDGRTNIFGDAYGLQMTNNRDLMKSIIGVMATLVEDSHDGDNSPIEVPESVETNYNTRVTSISNLNLHCTTEETPGEGASLTVDPTLAAFVTFRLMHYENSIFKNLNSIIGMLFNCEDFRDRLIDFYQSDQRSNIDFTVRSDLKSEDCEFVRDLCKLCDLFKKNLESKTLVCTTVKFVEKYFENKVQRFSLCETFDYLLKKINSVTKRRITERNTPMNDDDKAFFDHKCENGGFIHDLFYGQIFLKVYCDRCKRIIREQYEPINSLLLDLNRIQNKRPIRLEEYLQMYLKEIQINSNNKGKCNCNMKIENVRVITHSPKYLFICLNRESNNREMDKRLVETDNGIIVPVRDQKVLYQLCGVIDQSTHNTLKLGPNVWWSIDDHSMQLIQQPRDIVTERSCGFLFKKKIN